jgi:hypothetical protein
MRAAELHQVVKKYYFAYQCVDLPAYFQMDDDSDLRREILHVEARLEDLTDVVERCRKIILISKAAVAAGGVLILAIVIGAIRFDPTAMIGAIAAVIGGTVVFGSNTSTSKQITAEMKAAEAHRSELISRLHLRVVGDGEVEV